MKICGLLKTTLLDYPGHVACTVFTGGCNFRCPFCHNSELLAMDVPPEYTEQEIFAFIEKRKHTLEGVAITGGEPTLQKDLPDFIRKIRETWNLEVKLDTNGIAPELLNRLMEEKLLSYVAMDIKASPAKYAAACGIPEKSLPMEKIEESKNLLLQGKVPYEFRTTVVKGLHTAEDFPAIGEWIRGAERYALQFYQDSENVLCRDCGFESPKPEEMLTYRKLAAPFVRNIEIRGADIEL